MAALQARALAALGYGVLQLDLHGCGDSSGDFSEARWEQWQRDVALGVEWLRGELGRPVSLWGLRLGALLVLEHARTAGAGAIERIVLWQPVPDGTPYLTQFLRLRVASEMMGDKKTGGTDALRAALRSGVSLEIGGYELAPELADAIEARNAAVLAVAGCPVHWLEVVASAERPLAPASVRVIDAWRQAGTEVHTQTVSGQTFWATQEITECAALIDATCAIFGGVGT
jgi:exosortase A-associated hydrolase 2